MKTLSHPDLSRLTTPTLSFLFLTNFIAIWGEVVILAYFIIELDLSMLAIVLMLEALVWAFAANLQSRVQSNRGETQVLILTACVVTALVLIAIPLLHTAPTIAFTVLYLCVRSTAKIYRQHALAYIGPVYSARHRREQLVNQIIFAQVFAGIALLAIMPLIQLDSIIILLCIWLLAVLAHFVLALWLEQAAEEFETQSPEGGTYTRTITGRPSLVHIAPILENPLARWLTLSMLSIAFLSNVLLFQAASIVIDVALNIEGVLFFYVLSGVTGIWASLPIGYRMLSKMLQAYNAGTLISVYPVILISVLLGIFLFPVILFAFLSEIVRGPFRRVIYDALQRIVYHALPDAQQTWSLRFWQGVATPLGGFLAGATLLLNLSLSGNGVLLLSSVGVAALFFVSTQYAGRIYSKTLDQSLADKNYRVLRQATDDLTTSDQVFIQSLIERLQQGITDERELLQVVEVVSQSESEMAYTALCEVWYRSSDKLKAELLPFIIDAWPDKADQTENQALIQQALISTHPLLRQKALVMVARYAKLDPANSIARFLIDPDPKVDVVAAWILLRHPSVAVRHAARAQLRWLARDNNVSIRVTAVQALVSGSLNSFGELVHPLNIQPYMTDVATRVREAAMPAASVEQLLTAVCDPSSGVQQAAIRQLKARRFQGVLRHLIDTVEEQETRVVASNYLQIDVSLNYWRLLSAVRHLSWRPSRSRLLADLHDGFEQIDILDSIIIALTCLERDVFMVVIKQVERDRDDLLDIMIENLLIVADAERLKPSIWALRVGVDVPEYTPALQTIAQDTTPLLAQKFADALAKVNLDTSGQQSPLPTIAFEVLLDQQDEWRPLLTLFALSQLPYEQRERWTDHDAVRRVIDHSTRSKSGVIREGGRLVQRLLGTSEGGIPTYNLDQHLQKNESERLRMLSTLERMLFLRNVSYFENLQLDQLRSLARGCQEITAPENEVIIKQGTVGNSLFIVVEGTVRVEIQTEDHETRILSTLSAQEVFGEISLLDGSLRSASVVANSPVLLLNVHRDALNTALEDDPNIAMSMLQVLAQRLRQSNEMLGQQMQTGADD